MLNVIKVFFAGLHIRPKGVKKPLNPVIGEVFYCSWDDNNGQQLVIFLINLTIFLDIFNFFFNFLTNIFVLISFYFNFVFVRILMILDLLVNKYHTIHHGPHSVTIISKRELPFKETLILLMLNFWVTQLKVS